MNFQMSHQGSLSMNTEQTSRPRAEAQSEGQGPGLPEQPQPTPGLLLAKRLLPGVHLVAEWQAEHHPLSRSGPSWTLPNSYLNRRALQPRGHCGI